MFLWIRFLLFLSLTIQAGARLEAIRASPDRQKSLQKYVEKELPQLLKDQHANCFDVIHYNRSCVSHLSWGPLHPLKISIFLQNSHTILVLPTYLFVQQKSEKKFPSSCMAPTHYCPSCMLITFVLHARQIFLVCSSWDARLVRVCVCVCVCMCEFAYM